MRLQVGAGTVDFATREIYTRKIVGSVNVYKRQPQSAPVRIPAWWG